LKVENTPIESALRLAREQTADDENEAYREAVAPLRLTVGILLHGWGMTGDRNIAHYTLSDGDGEFTVEVRAPPPNSPTSTAINVPAEPPLFRQQPDESFRVVWLGDQHAVYCNFRSYTDLAAHTKSRPSWWSTFEGMGGETTSRGSSISWSRFASSAT